MNKLVPILATIVLSGAGLYAAQAQTAGNARNMSFFVSSTNGGKGADLGGIAGADALCQRLAQAAGAGKKTWHAYLSADAAAGKPAINARDRIGKGPWINANGAQVASSVANLHSDQNYINKLTAITEKGAMVNGRGDTPNMHDILTGSKPDGTLAAGQTCNNWTSSDQGTAMLGHHDRIGLKDDAPNHSWNSSHPSRGCSQEGLKSTGSDGRLYCFAVR